MSGHSAQVYILVTDEKCSPPSNFNRDVLTNLHIKQQKQPNCPSWGVLAITGPCLAAERLPITMASSTESKALWVNGKERMKKGTKWRTAGISGKPWARPVWYVFFAPKSLVAVFGRKVRCDQHDPHPHCTTSKQTAAVLCLNYDSHSNCQACYVKIGWNYEPSLKKLLQLLTWKRSPEMSWNSRCIQDPIVDPRDLEGFVPGPECRKSLVSWRLQLVIYKSY